MTEKTPHINHPSLSSANALPDKELTINEDFSALEDKVNDAVAILKSLANPHRLMILCSLNEGEKSVGELNKLFPIPQSSLSQHLAWLRKQNIVATRREAQTIFYSLHSDEVTEIISTLHNLYCKP